MPSLEQLQAAEAAQGTVQLRTLVLEFSDTLKRLPRLQQEIDGWLNQAPVGVDFSSLATRVEEQLVRATEWLVDYDMLPAAVRDAPEMKDFMQRVAYTATGRTLETMVQKFQGVKRDAENLAAKAKEAAEMRAAQASRLVALGFVVHDNGTVTDTNTRLMWKQRREAGTFTFNDAVARFTGMKAGAESFAGLTGWRLPSIEVLKTLVVAGQSPAICLDAFADGNYAFWSSSEGDTSSAWGVYFDSGSVYYGLSVRSHSYAVRLVRASQ